MHYLILAYSQDPVPLPLLHASGSATFDGIKLRFLVIDRLGRYVLMREQRGKGGGEGKANKRGRKRRRKTKRRRIRNLSLGMKNTIL